MTRLKPLALSLLAAALVAACGTNAGAATAMRVMLVPVLVSR